ncbi:MAG: hypothetical protein QGI21_00650 [Candidatus Poseidoniaceae archaeon]|jgi:hypothetical protein|nr:hypothetical protein [Candidatus Poseidoniaceae archaeon]
MSLTVPVVESFETTSRVTCVSSGVNLSFGQEDGTLVIGNDHLKLIGITDIAEFSCGDLLVACSDGLHCYRGVDEIWGHPMESGAESISINGQHAVVVDGIGNAHVFSLDGSHLKLKSSSVVHSSVANNIAIATDSGDVITYSLDGDQLWKRPMRGEIGETITAIGWDSNNLVVAREGHGLVPGEEEALEVEVWSDGVLLSRSDTRSRIVAIDGGWRGLDMGGVMLDDELVAELQHPVHLIIDFGEYCLAGSWFHLHRINKLGIEWSVETAGMVEFISSNSAGNQVLIAGEDQNDFTDSEPVILIDSTANAVALVDEETTIDDWGEAPAIEISADDLYGEEKSIEELAGITETNLIQNEGNLLEALNDEIEQNNEETEEEDLMLSLSLDAETIIAPTPDAGGDQQVSVSEEGTAIVTLDGTSTTDPQDRIQVWSWVDSTGREIGNTNKIRVKLKSGLHKFELRIRDKDGRWSSDSVDVRIG